MKATLPLISLVLLLGCLLSGPAVADYPFDPLPEGPGSVMPGPQLAPRRPRGLLRSGAELFRTGLQGEGLFRFGSRSSMLAGEPRLQSQPAGRQPPAMSGPYGAYPDGAYQDIVPFDEPPYGNTLYGEEGLYDRGPLYDQTYPDEALYGFDAAVWPGYISGNLTPGTERFLYGGEWFQPLYQDGQTLWYFDFRGQGDDHSASEFNVGTGVRVLSEPGWIFGGYAFWDHLRSNYGNNFNQGTLGVEAMSVLWDVRMNVYFPESKGKSAGAPAAVVSNGNLVVASGLEWAYWGMDFEVGRLLWACGPNAEQELRGFLALYHFDHSAPSTPSITGPRARLEYRSYDLPYFGPGSRFTLGLTLQADQVRDTQLFAFARLRIPLDVWAHDRAPMSPLHRRMLDRVVRDVDIVTNTSRRTEDALNPITGQEIRGYARIDANTPDAHEILDDLPSDSVIVVDGAAGDIPVRHKLQLKPGQAVVGAATSFNVVGADSGAVATFNPGGERPMLDFTHNRVAMATGVNQQNYQPDHAEIPGLWMNDQTQLVGVDIDQTRTGVGVMDAKDVLIKDVNISDFYGAGIEVAYSENVLLQDVHVRDAWTGVIPIPTDTPGLVGPPAMFAQVPPDEDPTGVGIFVHNSKNVLITDSQVEDTTAEGIRVGWSEDIAISNTTIRDTARDGIRLVDTRRVQIDDVELKNTGGSYFYGWSPDNAYRQLAGISLEQTQHTTITRSKIHGSKGVGVLGVEADGTLLSDLHIADVEHGVVFEDSENVAVVHSTILVPDEALRASRASRTPPGMFHTMDAWVPDHSGVILRDVTGEAIVADNEIRGGYAGAGVLFDADAGSTSLRVQDNVIERIGEAAVAIQTGGGHSLDAEVGGNNGHSDQAAFALRVESSGTNKVVVTENDWTGAFQTRVNDAGLELRSIDNHLGGDPMGRIDVGTGGVLQLQYDGNTSTAGADVIRFTSNGQFSAAISGNDHQPLLQNVIQFTQ